MLPGLLDENKARTKIALEGNLGFRMVGSA